MQIEICKSLFYLFSESLNIINFHWKLSANLEVKFNVENINKISVK